VDTARLVGKRKAHEQVILHVDAKAAHAAGHRFYHGKATIWLANEVPAGFVH
jgi:RNA:NAD 2'-phosphotransferase (TPT1/KptA family)